MPVELIKALPPVLLAVLVSFVVLVAAVLGAWLTIVGVRRGWTINIPFFKIGPNELAPRDKESVGAPPATTIRPHRKILYVKVTYLRSGAVPGAKPFYERVVRRLDGPDRTVPVFDEAVYYTLEMFPKKAAIEGRQDTSSGVVDTSIVVPWTDNIGSSEANVNAMKQLVNLDAREASDTLLTVSHFENGLQTSATHNFATKIPDDSEYARLVVDFSSIPGASAFVNCLYACVRTRENTETRVGFIPSGESVYTAWTAPTGKGDVLKMYFAIDWSRAPAA